MTVLIIKGNDEEYTYDESTDSMTGNGQYLDTMNIIIANTDYGDNPYQDIANIYRSMGYQVTYEQRIDRDQLDGI